LSDDVVGDGWEVVEVLPPRDTGDVPASVPRFVHQVMELQTRWLGLVNASPVTVFEIRRHEPGRVRLQFAVPTQRLMRKIRLHLSEAVPGVGFADGVSGLPVSDGCVVSGGLLSLGRSDMFPLETEFDRSPVNNVIAALHQDAFPRESVVIQVLFRPVAGRPVRRWWWKRRAFKRVGWLKKEKHAVASIRERPATRIEKQQARLVESKARSPQFDVGVRCLFVGTREDLVRSRVKELGSAFNVYESSVSNQYLDTYTVSAFSEDTIREFAAAVAHRLFDTQLFRFRLGIPELAGLVAVPTINQDNLRTASP
jgi:hypothetical protein